MFWCFHSRGHQFHAVEHIPWVSSGIRVQNQLHHNSTVPPFNRTVVKLRRGSTWMTFNFTNAQLRQGSTGMTFNCSKVQLCYCSNCDTLRINWAEDSAVQLRQGSTGMTFNSATVQLLCPSNVPRVNWATIQLRQCWTFTVFNVSTEGFSSDTVTVPSHLIFIYSTVLTRI